MLTRTEFAALAMSAAGACMMCLTPVTASARNQPGDIVVSPAGTMEQWQQQTTTRLDRALARAYSSNGNTGNVIVQIAFTRGPDGRPANPRFVNSEGSWLERSMARQAVMSLSNLDSVPVTQPGEPTFLANLIFADDAHILAQLRDRLAVMERTRMAANDERRSYIALGY